MFRDTYKVGLEGYEKFWTRTQTNRPTLHMTYNDPKPGNDLPYHYPANPEEQWLDEVNNYYWFKNWVRNSGVLAEGVPTLFTNLGAGCLSACLGGGYKLAPSTIWFAPPIVHSWDNPPAPVLDEQSLMWQHVVRLQNYYAHDPEICFSITDLGGIMDIVASLRGTENLLYDLYDDPEAVKAYSAKVTDQWFIAYDKQIEVIRKAGLPYASWMGIPSEKPWYPLQCDFCAMISPAQFEEFVLPDLVRQTEYMERSIYHLDGPGELPHLDMLLDIPGLTGIQWVPGDGRPHTADPAWFDIFRRIQDKKKNLVLLGAISEDNIDRAERLIKSIDPTGVYISCHFSSRERAEDMLEKITRWSE